MTDPTHVPEPRKTLDQPPESEHSENPSSQGTQHLRQSEWEPATPAPQDAPRWSPAQPNTTLGQSTSPSSPTALAGDAPSGLQGRPEVTYLPRPTGPNWGLVLMGLALVVVGAGVFANQLSGFQVSQLADTGPGVLVGVGLLCALVGVVGMVGRRRP